MFVFIIARTPLSYRNYLRDQLWELTKKSLINQTCSDWKAIIVGNTTEDDLPLDKFISLDFDNYTKGDKLKIAIDFIESGKMKKPDYIIRLDDDDIFSTEILTDIVRLNDDYDCYYDEFHTYIDLVYLKISQRKKSWLPNTMIHHYNHALKKCGPDNAILILQDHSKFWHHYYLDKKVYKARRNNPLYYRILSTSSITSLFQQNDQESSWTKHLNYLKGYGPWIKLPRKFIFFKELYVISTTNYEVKPKITIKNMIYNRAKFFKNILLNK